MAITLVEHPMSPIKEAINIGTPKLVAQFTVQGEPASKARPRFVVRENGGHAFTPHKTHVAEQQVAQAYLEATHRKLTDKSALYRVEAVFYCGTRQRRDVDNMVKLLLDGLNEWAWPDDSQVLEISAAKRYVAKKEARTEAKVFIIGSMSPMEKICAECGKPFRVYPSSGDRIHFCSQRCKEQRKEKELVSAKRLHECQYCHKQFYTAPSSNPKYCSVECRNEAGRITITCIVCGKQVRKRKSSKAQSYCSQACMKKDYRARQKKLGIGAGQCVTCGGPVSRKEYKQCQPCYWATKR